MKRIFSLFFALILFLGTVFAVRFAQIPSYTEKTSFALNTVVKITAYGENASDAVEKAIKEIHRIDSVMSAHSITSEIYMLNNSNGGRAVSKEVFDLIKRAKQVWEKTNGAFDITLKPVSDLWNVKAESPRVPEAYEIEQALLKTGFENIKLIEQTNEVLFEKDGMSIDLGGIAKGYAADRAAMILKDNSINSALIDLGGNVYAIGKNKNRKSWKIGIQSPWKERGDFFEAVQAEDEAVVTSGAYERYFEKDGEIYHHIIDPKTGYPSKSEFSSVTVIHKNSAIADALSTAVFVAGSEGATEAKSQFKDAKIIVMTNDGKIIKY